MDRIGKWIQTYRGAPFWPLDPRSNEVAIQDIARSLSMKCRYGGHVMRFYSVAEHSVYISQNVSPENALWGLLHDAAEAYSADIPRPLKFHLMGFTGIETAIMWAICDRFGLDRNEPEEVKRVDYAITADEKDQILYPSLLEWEDLPQPLGIEIKCLNPAEAESLFLNRFFELWRGL